MSDRKSDSARTESYLHPGYFLQLPQGSVSVTDEDGDHPQVTGRLQINLEVIQENHLNAKSMDTSITSTKAKFMHKGHWPETC